MRRTMPAIALAPRRLLLRWRSREDSGGVSRRASSRWPITPVSALLTLWARLAAIRRTTGSIGGGAGRPARIGDEEGEGDCSGNAIMGSLFPYGEKRQGASRASMPGGKSFAGRRCESFNAFRAPRRQVGRGVLGIF